MAFPREELIRSFGQRSVVVELPSNVNTLFCSKQFAWLLYSALLSETLDSKAESRREKSASEHYEDDESSL